ncbi:zinc finger BED domain-containing protein RICESLEEPER 2-like protein [Tanacetum coccineum]
MHVCCCAHVWNLIVQSGLKVIQESVEKVQDSVKFVRGSAARKTKFAECIARCNLQCGKHVRQYVVTRWNYTYLMLDCALVYRRAFVLLEKLDKTFKTSPTQEEWTRIEAIAVLRKCLADADLHVPLDEIRIDKTLHFVEEPLEILDREVKSLKRSRIPIVKVRLNSKCGPKFTWEREDHMKVKYPQLLVENTSEPSV